jgi:hypothetical protein
MSEVKLRLSWSLRRLLRGLRDGVTLTTLWHPRCGWCGMILSGCFKWTDGEDREGAGLSYTGPQAHVKGAHDMSYSALPVAAARPFLRSRARKVVWFCPTSTRRKYIGLLQTSLH